MRAARHLAAIALLALALHTASAAVGLEGPSGGHGHAARAVGVVRGAGDPGDRGARLPLPTPQELEAVRQLVRLLAALAGGGSGGQTQQASRDSLLESAPAPPPSRHRAAPAPAPAPATLPPEPLQS